MNAEATPSARPPTFQSHRVIKLKASIQRPHSTDVTSDQRTPRRRPVPPRTTQRFGSDAVECLREVIGSTIARKNPKRIPQGMIQYPFVSSTHPSAVRKRVIDNTRIPATTNGRRDTQVLEAAGFDVGNLMVVASCSVRGISSQLCANSQSETAS